MDARYNWWGHDSGPLDTSDDSASGGLYNPTGQGDRVTNYVNYMPWTTSDPGADEDSIADDLALIYGMDPFALDSGGRIPGGEEPLFQGMGWSSNPPETPSPPIIYASGDETVLSAWDIFDNDPSGAQILRVYDAELGKTAIQLDGNGIENGYRLRNTDGTWWNNTEHPVIQWRIKASEPFVVYVVIQTTEGLRYLQYTPGEGDVVDMGTGIEHKLGSTGSGWYTFARDLDLDLAAGQPDSAFEAVMGFLVRGTCLVDDVRTLAEIPVDHDTDGDGYADAVEISAGTDPMDPASHP